MILINMGSIIFLDSSSSFSKKFLFSNFLFSNIMNMRLELELSDRYLKYTIGIKFSILQYISFL